MRAGSLFVTPPVSFAATLPLCRGGKGRGYFVKSTSVRRRETDSPVDCP